jgi:hypothetical protein
MNWVRDAIEYDAREAVKRAEMLDAAQRAQLDEDVKTLAATIRGMVSLSALALSSCVGQDGTLCRPVEIRDAVAMVRTALAGLHLIHAQSRTDELSRTDIDRVLRTGSESQRLRAVGALRQLQDLAREIEGEG